MALIQCHKCGSMISDQASNCPKCGAPSTRNTQTQYSQQKETLEVSQRPAYQQVNNYPSTSNNVEPESNQVCRILGVVLIILGILDYCLGNFAEIDITGVWWSPILLGAIGSALLAVKKKS